MSSQASTFQKVSAPVRRSGYLLAFLLLAVVISGCTSGSGSGSTQPSFDPTAPSATPAMSTDRWWDSRTFYEIFVRSFKDSDGDGIGDLKGLTSQLDYLNDGNPSTTEDLGVTGLWLMPIFASPSYHGYDVTDYRTVNPDYGTNADLKTLVEEAHKRGIAIILDLTINHSSIDHPWFAASEAGKDDKADWYRWSDTKPNEIGPWGQQVWHERNGRYYFGLFDSRMPDYNLANPAVTAELVDIARFWMDEAGVDGYRLDGAQHLVENETSMANTDETKAWLTTFHTMLHETHPKALVVGEIWSSSSESRQYVPGQVDLAFDFDSAEAAARVAGGGNARGLADAGDLFLGGYPDGQVAVFTDNHDKTRLATIADRDPARLTLIAAWQLTQRGVPFLYYGQEIALRGDKPDERIRTPMPWTENAENGGFTTGKPWQDFQFGHGETGPNAMNVAAQAKDPASLLSAYRKLIALRNDSAAIRTGAVGTVDAGSFDVIAYTRTEGSDTVLVIMNGTDAPISDYGIKGSIGKASGWEVVLGRADKLPDSAEPQGFKPVETLKPWETVILRSKG